MKKTRLVTLALVLTLVLSLLLTACSAGPAAATLQTELTAAKSQVSSLQTDIDAANGKIASLEADLVQASVYDASKFVKWFEEEGTWRTIQNAKPADNNPGGFITTKDGAPTEEDLKAMLHMASLAVTSGGKSDWYMVAVTDPAEQLAIIGDKYGVATSEGTVTVLIFGERLLRADVRTDENAPFQPDRGYYDAGIVTGYLNAAAIALGYGSHMFMSPALPGVNGFNDGDVGLDTAKYLEGTQYYSGSTHQSYSNENMKFVNAVVIGTLDETVESGVTDKEFPDNWIIWEK